MFKKQKIPEAETATKRNAETGETATEPRAVETAVTKPMQDPTLQMGVLTQPEPPPRVREPARPKPAGEGGIEPQKREQGDHEGGETPALSGAFGASRKSGFQKFLDGFGTIGLGREKVHFIENLAILLNSGLSVIDSLKTVQMELRSKPMKKMVSRIIGEVESGIALWRAMDNQSCFSPYALSLIRIGEEAGSLSKNMEYLAAQQEKDRSLRSKVKMAMIYPSIVLTLTIGITLGLAWFVLPKLVTVLTSLGVKLPLITRIIIWVANFFQANGSVAVPLAAALAILLVILCKYTRLRGPVQQCIFHLPGIGTMARSATVAQFGVVLGSLLKAGVPLVESIRSMANVTDIVLYQRFYFRLADEIEVGQSFASAFQAIKETRSLIPISVQQLIITGEKSGRVADILMRIADIYEKKAEESAQRLPVILEPILILFIGGLVGTIALAIIVPIYSIVGSVGR